VADSIIMADIAITRQAEPVTDMDCGKMTRDWAALLTREIINEVKRQREARGWSAQRLSDECKRLGFDLSRSTIADLENGRRAHFSIPELLVLARAFGTAPLMLIFRVGAATETEVLPGQVRSPFGAAKWFTGEAPFPGAAEDDTYIAGITDDWNAATKNPLALYRAHDRALAEEMRAIERAAMMDNSATAAKDNAQREAFTAAAAALRRDAEGHRAARESIRRDAERLGLLPPGQAGAGED